MCKYNTYAIEIIHLNGNKQLREAEDNTSYNSTIALYHEVKEQYIDKDVVINFVGLTVENEQGLIFSKKNTIIEGERKSIKNLMTTILEASKQLQEQYRIIGDKESYYDKKKSNIDHLFIEAVDIEELTDEEKINIFNEIRDVNLMRRDYKILNNIRANTHNDVNYIVQKAQNILNEYDKHIQKNSNKLKDLIKRDAKRTEVHLIKEIPYKDFKDRMKIMNEITKDYDKVIHFPERKVIACYNKCG